MRLILDAIVKTLSIIAIRRLMKLRAREMLWLRDSIASDEFRLGKLEKEQRRLQARVWMLEAPGSLVKHAYHRPSAGPTITSRRV